MITESCCDDCKFNVFRESDVVVVVVLALPETATNESEMKIIDWFPYVVVTITTRTDTANIVDKRKHMLERGFNVLCLNLFYTRIFWDEIYTQQNKTIMIVYYIMHLIGCFIFARVSSIIGNEIGKARFQ